MKSLLQKLVETPGPPGYETEIRRLVRSEVEPYAQEIRVDGLGNLIVRKGQLGPGGRRILALAHMDEPGLIVSHVNRSGLARFMPLGDLQPAVCAGQRVRFLNGAHGVVGYPAADNNKKAPGIEELFVDLGGSASAGSPVRTGDVAVFAGPFKELGPCVAGKALDNRVGVAILIECLRRLPETSPHEVFFAFTTQEQPGLRGAGAAAFGVQADILLAVDVCDAGDTPGGSADRGGAEICLGCGPVIRVRDQYMLSHPGVVNWAAGVAEASGIPYQKEIAPSPGSGASVAQAAGEGAAAGVLATACRYRGSPAEVVNWSDVEHLANLLARMLTGPASF
jgi:endoglucanase